MTGNDRQTVGGQVAADELQVGPACGAGDHVEQELAGTCLNLLAVTCDERRWPFGGRVLQSLGAHLALYAPSGLGGRWYGTSATIVFRLPKSRSFSRRLVWLWSSCSHQCRGTNSESTTTIGRLGSWACSASM